MSINQFWASIWTRPERLLTLVYIGLAVTLLPYYWRQINPDAVSYFSIAEHYAQGRFYEAINGYWSPLYSWLAAPTIPFVGRGIWVFKLINIMAGAAAIYFWTLYFKQKETRNRLEVVYFWSILITPFVLYFSLAVVSPDVLFTAFLGVYFYFSTNEPSRRNAVFLGLAAAFTYFAKGFGFPLLAVHLFFLFVFQKKAGLKYSRKQMATALAVFLFVSSLWAGGIYWKYDQFTFSLAGGFNHALTHPDCKGYPEIFRGYQPPPYPSSVSVWEDPTLIGLKDWNAFSSKENWAVQFHFLLKNVATLGRILTVYFLPTIVVFFWAGYHCFWGNKSISKSEWFFVALFAGGLSCFPLEDRYLIPVWLFILYWVIKLTLDFKLTSDFLFVKNALVQGIILLFLPFSFYRLYDKANLDVELKAQVEVLQKHIPVGATVMANDNWAGALHLSHYAGWKFCGLTPIDIKESEINDLNKIEAVLIWKFKFENNQGKLMFLGSRYAYVHVDKEGWSVLIKQK